MENDEIKSPELEQDENKNQDELENNSDQENEEDDGVDWKKEALKYKAILSRNKEKKPEPKSEPKKEVSSGVNPKDLYAMTQANVHIDDFDDVVDYAKFKGISVAEALKSDVIKSTLATKSEFRKTAQMTNTGNARKAPQKVSDETIMKNLSEGKIPEKGSEEAERLFWARRGGKR